MFRTAAVSVDKPDDKGLGARKSIIPYGLYRAHGFISAPLAEHTGFSTGDLELFWDALVNMFDQDRSASRGEMACQKLIIFKHEKKFGNASAHKLFDLIKITRKDQAVPPRQFSDYEVTIAKEGVPNGVTIEERG
jgi:CRISPR-associated protein Csd2